MYRCGLLGAKECQARVRGCRPVWLTGVGYNSLLSGVLCTAYYVVVVYLFGTMKINALDVSSGAPPSLGDGEEDPVERMCAVLAALA